jgi:uncharacterized protein DUF1905
LKWVIIRIPLDVAKTWGTRGRLKVKGEINGFPFRTSLFPSRNGGHIVIVNKRMQAGAKTAPGMVARFILQPDTKERTVSTPAELKRACGNDRTLLRWYGRLNYSTRKEIAAWITDVKAPRLAPAAPIGLPSDCWPPWRASANCHPSCRWLSRTMPAHVRGGNACRCLGDVGTCWEFSIIEARKRGPGGSPRQLRMRKR